MYLAVRARGACSRRARRGRSGDLGAEAGSGRLTLAHLGCGRRRDAVRGIEEDLLERAGQVACGPPAASGSPASSAGPCFMAVRRSPPRGRSSGITRFDGASYAGYFNCAMATPVGRAKMRYLSVALLARRARP